MENKPLLLVAGAALLIASATTFALGAPAAVPSAKSYGSIAKAPTGGKLPPCTPGMGSAQTERSSDWAVPAAQQAWDTTGKMGAGKNMMPPKDGMMPYGDNTAGMKSPEGVPMQGSYDPSKVGNMVPGMYGKGDGMAPPGGMMPQPKDGAMGNYAPGSATGHQGTGSGMTGGTPPQGGMMPQGSNYTGSTPPPMGGTPPSGGTMTAPAAAPAAAPAPAPAPAPAAAPMPSAPMPSAPMGGTPPSGGMPMGYNNGYFQAAAAGSPMGGTATMPCDPSGMGGTGTGDMSGNYQNQGDMGTRAWDGSQGGTMMDPNAMSDADKAKYAEMAQNGQYPMQAPPMPPEGGSWWNAKQEARCLAGQTSTTDWSTGRKVCLDAPATLAQPAKGKGKSTTPPSPAVPKFSFDFKALAELEDQSTAEVEEDEGSDVRGYVEAYGGFVNNLLVAQSSLQDLYKKFAKGKKPSQVKAVKAKLAGFNEKIDALTEHLEDIAQTYGKAMTYRAPEEGVEPDFEKAHDEFEDARSYYEENGGEMEALVKALNKDSASLVKSLTPTPKKAAAKSEAKTSL